MVNNVCTRWRRASKVTCLLHTVHPLMMILIIKVYINMIWWILYSEAQISDYRIHNMYASVKNNKCVAHWKFGLHGHTQIQRENKRAKWTAFTVMISHVDQCVWPRTSVILVTFFYIFFTVFFPPVSIFARHFEACMTKRVIAKRLSHRLQHTHTHRRDYRPSNEPTKYVLGINELRLSMVFALNCK